jgi:hypothetical protein
MKVETGSHPEGGNPITDPKGTRKMKHEDLIAKTQIDKIQAKLQQAKAKLDGLVATAKDRKLQSEIETINELRDKEDEIRARIQEFNAPGDAQVSQVRADLRAKVAKFEEEVRRLATKLKS